MKNKRLLASILAGFMAFILLLSLILSLIPTKTSAKSSSEIKDQITEMENQEKELEKELAALEAQQKENLNDINEMVEQKAVIDRQTGVLHQQVDLLNEQIAAYALLIADKQLEVDAAEKRLAELNLKHKERIRAMEEDGGVSYWSVLFQANSFSDFLDRLNMIQEIAAADRRRLAEIREVAQELAVAQETLRMEKAALEENKAVLAEKQAEQEAKRAEADELLQKLLATGREYQELLDKQEQQMANLASSIAQAKIDYEDAKYQEYLAYIATLPTGGGKISYDSNGIAWVVPCSYTAVTSPFGWREHPVLGGRRHHDGVDFDISCPNKIYATRAGVVTVSVSDGWGGGYGNYVVIDHLDGFQSLYAHMCSPPDVYVGQVVTAGQVLGCIGQTGYSTGDHLHFGIMKDGEFVNPMIYVGN